MLAQSGMRGPAHPCTCAHPSPVSPCPPAIISGGGSSRCGALRGFIGPRAGPAASHFGPVRYMFQLFERERLSQHHAPRAGAKQRAFGITDAAAHQNRARRWMLAAQLF